MQIKKEDAIEQFSHGYVVYSKAIEHEDIPEGFKNRRFLHDYVVKEIIEEGPYSSFESERQTVFSTLDEAIEHARSKRAEDIKKFDEEMLAPAHKSYNKRNNLAMGLVRSFAAAVSDGGKKYKQRFDTLGPLLSDVQAFIEQLEKEVEYYQPEIKIIPDEFSAPRILPVGQTIYEVNLSANRFLDEGIQITEHTITDRSIEYDDVNTHRSPYLLQVSYMMEGGSGFKFDDDSENATELTGSMYQHRYFTDLETAQKVARETAQEYLSSAQRMVKKFTP